jgi:hypothetical protein
MRKQKGKKHKNCKKREKKRTQKGNRKKEIKQKYCLTQQHCISVPSKSIM